LKISLEGLNLSLESVIYKTLAKTT